MVYSLLFFVVLIAILIATVQDLKRREVDNWLNYGLLLFGIVYVIYHALFTSDISYLINGVILVFIGFCLHYLFYFGRVFAGGDAKLLFALSPYFTSINLTESIFGFFVFIFLMFLCGGIYGMCYSLVLYLYPLTTVVFESLF